MGNPLAVMSLILIHSIEGGTEKTSKGLVFSNPHGATLFDTSGCMLELPRLPRRRKVAAILKLFTTAWFIAPCSCDRHGRLSPE